MSPKAVAFLDLLGFSVAVQSDPEGAVGMLQDQSSALKDAIAEQMLHPVADYEDAAMQHLEEAGMVTSFDSFLPMSDSVFVTSAEPNLFVRQLSHLLVDLFRFRLNAYAAPESKDDPRRVTMNSVEVIDGAVEMTSRQATWLPVLYRGGVEYGEVWMLEMPAVSEAEALPNVAGPAVINAVKLEKEAVKGPRLACSAEFAQAVTGDAASYISTVDADREDMYHEILWPMAMFEDSTGPKDAILNHLGEWITGAMNLWCHFRETDVGEQYLEFIALTIKSFLARWPDAQREWPELPTIADRLKAFQQTPATELDALLPSILNKALKGEL